MPKKIPILLFTLLFLSANNVLGHQTSDSYLALSITNNRVEGRWAIALRDLNHVLEIDLNKDGEVSDEELSKGRASIERYAFDRLKIEMDSKAMSFAPTGFDI